VMSEEWSGCCASCALEKDGGLYFVEACLKVMDRRVSTYLRQTKCDGGPPLHLRLV
jgi:hypothetical protein